MKRIKETRKKIILAKIARIRTTAIMMAMLLMLALSTNTMAQKQEKLENYASMKMDKYSDNADESEYSLDDMELATADNTNTDYMSDIGSMMVSGYDAILKSMLKYFAPRVIAILIIFLFFELLLFYLIITLARKQGRNIIAWCMFGAFVTPLIAALVLLIAGKRKEDETHFFVIIREGAAGTTICQPRPHP